MRKAKDCIFIVAISYMLIILFLIMHLFIIKKPYIELKTPQVVKDSYNVLKMEIETIKNKECKAAVSDLLAKSIINSYDGKVSINKLYDYIAPVNVTKDYDIINKKCNISPSKVSEYNIDNKYLDMMTLRQAMVSNYFYQYELSFHDELSREYYDNLTKVSYNTLKYTETELLENYIRIIGGQ